MYRFCMDSSSVIKLYFNQHTILKNKKQDLVSQSLLIFVFHARLMKCGPAWEEREKRIIEACD